MNWNPHFLSGRRDWRAESSPEDASSLLSLQSQEESSGNRACVSLRSWPFLEFSVDDNYFSVPRRQASKRWSSQGLEIWVFQRVCRVSTPYCFLMSEYNSCVTFSPEHSGMPHQPLAGRFSLPVRSSSWVDTSKLPGPHCWELSLGLT